MPLDAAALGEHVRTLRESKGLSIGKAARRAGITTGYWHAMEKATPSGSTGRAAVPRVPVLRAIADALDADRADLLELAGYEEDAAFDRARDARLARERPVPAALGDWDTLSEADQEYVRELVQRLAQRGEGA